MTLTRLVRAELRKLTTTKMPLAFLLVLIAISATTAIAVIFGTDMDGSKTFISTADDQRSLMAFAANATMIAGLFGAIAVAREYGHGTVIPMFLSEPRRSRAMVAQYSAVFIGGGVLGLVGAVLTVLGVAVGLTATEFGFMLSAAGVAQVLAASALAGAAGALVGAGLGAIIRNTGGATTGAVVALLILPPLLVQLASGTASWVPASLAAVLSGVSTETAVPAAIAVLAMWALVPAAVGLLAVRRRDVV